jgi:hypothetical protein
MKGMQSGRSIIIKAIKRTEVSHGDRYSGSFLRERQGCLFIKEMEAKALEWYEHRN